MPNGESADVLDLERAREARRQLRVHQDRDQILAALFRKVDRLKQKGLKPQDIYACFQLLAARMAVDFKMDPKQHGQLAEEGFAFVLHQIGLAHSGVVVSGVVPLPGTEPGTEPDTEPGPPDLGDDLPMKPMKPMKPVA